MAHRIDPEGEELDALRALAPVDGLRVLELGCGDGRLTFRYAEPAASVLAQPDLVRGIGALPTPPVLRERCVLRRLGACA